MKKYKIAYAQYNDEIILFKNIKGYLEMTEDSVVKINKDMLIEQVELIAATITDTMPKRYLNLKKTYINQTETLDDTLDIVLCSGSLVVIFFILILIFKKKLVSIIKLRIDDTKQKSLRSHNIEYIEDSEDGRKKRKSMKRKSVKRKSVKRKSVKRKSVKRKSVKRKSVKRKSVKRKSVKRKSVKRKSVKRKSVNI